jgi:hypothetical protein
MLQRMELDAVGREAVGGSINKAGYSDGSELEFKVRDLSFVLVMVARLGEFLLC